MADWKKIPVSLLVGLIEIYQHFLSPLKGGKCCRFVPSCSQYAKEALQIHGVFKGCGLALWRLLRCHPFYHGNLVDPVPPKKTPHSP